ncbi:MAG TPA: multicopper oxidase domain-containing protein [Hyphomicrobiaceae bacterium]|nr:multicopper oxidase domain-containing protein [Hyphomicrobiaceae bacterium]
MREAQRARNNRAEIHRALINGQVSRRDLIKWGILTTGGYLVCKNGLSPLASSAFADGVPTGTPPSPLFGAKKFVSKMRRLDLQHPVPMTKLVRGTETDAVFGGNLAGERPARRLSYHNEFTANPNDPNFINPITGVGPIEGRPPNDGVIESFAHQRWDEFFPKVGYVLSLSQVAPRQNFFPGNDTVASNGSAPFLEPNAAWTYARGHTDFNTPSGTLPPPLFKGRYGEPIITRIYNNLPVDRTQNGGFGRNQHQLHFHNAHNGAESDGAANVHHFPGTFYDYRWSTTLARRDKINIDASDPNTGGPNDGTGIVRVAGDFREYQGTMWAHDHRFFFTAENVYKGMLMMINYYSAKDRGHEVIGGPNLRLPSGKYLPWGNIDFDVNLIISDAALDPDGQYFFDIFTTDGMIGDIPLVNFAYAPYMEVLPRKYRFRILAASMSRFWKFAIASPTGTAVPFQFICNDGNLVVHPLTLTELDEQGIAERYDIVVDFSKFRVGDRLHLVDRLKQTSGNKPDGPVSLADALKGNPNDPVLGAILQFRVVSILESVDAPGKFLRSTDPDPSQVPDPLTVQIPIETPVRTRLVEFGRSGNGDSRDPVTGQCTPDCSEVVFNFPWTIRINGQEAHSMNANRVSLVIPKSGEIEHWTYRNGGGGWDHPIHLHFEEGITMNRGTAPIPDTERLVRKDVWRLRPGGQVQFQIQFGEYGGSYVNHCHNTVHEDFALLMRIQLLVSNITGSPPFPPQTIVTNTPNPSPAGVTFTTPEILPEGDPRTPV